MRAVTFHAPGEVRVEDRPEPELLAGDDAVVRVLATGICGSDLHIYHGRVAIEPGFTIGHEFVGTVVAAGPDVTRVTVGDRVLGCFHTACGICFHCLRGEYHRCVESRTFGHGATLGSLQGTQADMALVPRANMVLRRVPEAMSNETALFAGDVMGTGLHATVLAVDSVAERLEVARAFGATPVHLDEQDVRAEARALTGGRGVDVCIDAVGHPAALDTAVRITRACGTVQCIGVYTERLEVHMGLLWLKSITLRGGQANVIAHVDRVLSMFEAGTLDPARLVTHRMALDEAPEAYAIYDRREALKIVLEP
jgi:2-desacetyl-2-hydroxyethyl bacteriochlorophyllide A dehydrogenase